MNEKEIVIVLGKKLRDDGTPENELIDRVKCGILMAKTHDCLLLFTGGKANKKTNISEARAMEKIMRELGENSRKPILEEESKTTKENAKLCFELLKGKDISKIYVVSSYYHFHRRIFVKADVAFSRVFRDVEIVAVPSSVI